LLFQGFSPLVEDRLVSKERMHKGDFLMVSFLRERGKIQKKISLLTIIRTYSGFSSRKDFQNKVDLEAYRKVLFMGGPPKGTQDPSPIEGSSNK